ncbi:uncharacterized protein LOC108458128 isoform X2 [Gossypium arboreum]|uniref:uncharacterized protein LOC108458128 isoform X2 n=1 Tax=Gossypium arboreum TaxID=29729 RepID=UPI0022F1C213|nr:uncharacterized protein LOC108458128 isoform X2 [Gossypium arboreum]
MPSEDLKSVKKEEPEEDNEDLKSLSSMRENRKKKPSSNSNNAAISNSKLRPKEAEVKKEEPIETDDEDEKPISKRSSATKATKPKKEESDDEDEKPISKRSSATKADKVKRVAAGLLHSTCIDETGSLFVFGDKVVANLGFGEAKNATMPSMINTLPYSEEVACGGYHTCVVTSNSFIFIIKCFCMFLFI